MHRKIKQGEGLELLSIQSGQGNQGRPVTGLPVKRSQSSGGLTEGREGAIQTPREEHATDREGDKCKGLEVRMSLVCV